MRIVPIVSIESYLLGKLIGYALYYGIVYVFPIMSVLAIVMGIVMTIVQLVRDTIVTFLASAFYANLVATWNAIVAFFEAYGWIFELVFAIIGFITSVILITRGVKIACKWISERFYDIKCAIRRK